MINLIWVSLRVRFTVASNRLLHFFKRVPLIKRLFPQSVYGNGALKTLFMVIGFMFVMNKKTLFHLFYMMLLTASGVALCLFSVYGGITALGAGISFDEVTAAGSVSFMLTVWFIASFIGSPVSSITIGAFNHNNDKHMLHHFRVDAALYAKSRILADNVSGLVLYLPTLLIAFAAARMPLWYAFVALPAFIAFRLAGEAVNLAMYRFTKLHFGQMVPSLIGNLVYPAAFVVPYFIGTPDWAAVMINPLTVLLILAIGGLSLLQINRYRLYPKIYNDTITRNEAWYAKAREYQKQGVHLGMGASHKDAQNWSKNVGDVDLKPGIHSDKSGFAYLNAIFFARHKGFFNKKMLLRIFFLLIPFAASALFFTYCIITTGETPSNIFDNNFFNRDIRELYSVAPLFLYVIYFASMGRVVTASVFTNCDIHMLHYPYYRTAKTILASFKARFSVILLQNFIITTVMFLSVQAALHLLFGGTDLAYGLIFYALLTFIGVLFAFNDLFLYYFFQPYDGTGKGKSTVYGVINTVIYILVFMNIYINPPLVPYTVFIAAVTLAYLALGMFLLLKYAPKRFKLR
jgi:hypothetical protein